MTRFRMGIILTLACVATAAAQAQTASEYVAHGMQLFRDNQIEGSLQAFDRAARLDAETIPRLWQRGISYYYAGQFERGRDQFLTHRQVNPHDVENAAWHFLCVARLSGLEAARKSLMPIDTKLDRRVPMTQIYRFYEGDVPSATVLDAAEQAGTPLARMYAHLYLGLYHEVAGDVAAAESHLRQAAATALDDNYMYDVACVHLRQRGW